jgi:hypothetical protein
MAAVMRLRAFAPYTAWSARSANTSAYMATSRGCVTVRCPDTSSTATRSSSKIQKLSIGQVAERSTLSGMTPNEIDGSALTVKR